MIKIKPMPTITPMFLQGLIYVAQERLKYFKKYPLNARDPRAVSRATTIKYLVPVVRKERSALDLMLTRLRKLDYVSFDFENSGGDFKDGKFVCKTSPLVMSDVRSSRKWDIGSYVVNVSVYGIMNAALDTFKMQPDRTDLYREEHNTYWGYPYHPHHCSKNTCWGEWINALTEGCRNCNFDMLFGAFIGFLRTYNSGSPLVTPPLHDHSDDPEMELFWMKLL